MFQSQITKNITRISHSSRKKITRTPTCSNTGTVLKGKVKEHICEEGKPPMLRVELIGEKGHIIYKVW